MPRKSSARSSETADLSLALSYHCVRNPLEDLHAGITPSTKTGDWSDVKVVTPYGEIPWTKLSRISDEEMKELMIEVVNSLYTALTNITDPSYAGLFLRRASETKRKWNEPRQITILGTEPHSAIDDDAG
jgi:hypothetical protein